MNFYSSISKYYDQIFPLSQDQLQFILSSTQPVKDKNILEIGSGTGNLAIALAAEGANISGLDYNQEMVDQANSKITDLSTPNINFQMINMLDINKTFVKGTFDAIICVGNTLAHLDNIKEVNSFITKARLLLNNKGKLLIQIVNYDWVLKNNIEFLPTKDNNDICFERKYKQQNSKILFETTLTIKKSNKTIQNTEVLLPILKNNIVDILKDHQFSKINYYGDFKQSVYTNKSNGLVIEAYV